MSLVPKDKQGKVAFFLSKIAPWTANATAIGTTAGAVTALDALVDLAQAKLAAQTSAEAAYRTAVAEADEAVEAMARAGADIISAIRTKGRTGGEAVFNLAQIPAPAQPSPRGNPGTPEGLTVQLDGDGALRLKWKCTQPQGVQGTFYQVYRNDTGNVAGPFKELGLAGARTFTDATVPAGATAVVYKIRAVRTTCAGLWATFNVVFGANAPGGLMVTKLDDAEAPRRAA